MLVAPLARRLFTFKSLTAVSMAAVLCLQGCGGGGGGGDSKAPAETPTPDGAVTAEADPPLQAAPQTATSVDDVNRLRALGYPVFETTGEIVDSVTGENLSLTEIDDAPSGGTLSVTTGMATIQSVPRMRPLVVGGESATVGQFPWVSFLSTPDGSCTAIVIDSRWLQTQAHCMPAAAPLSVSAQIGFVGSSPDLETIPVDYFVKLPNDVALVHLVSPTKYAPIAYNGNPSPSPYSFFRSVGFGRTSLSGPAGELKFVDNTVTSYDPQYPGFLTVGSPGSMKSICFGDSGGPLVVYGTDGLPLLMGSTSATFAPYCTGLFLASLNASLSSDIQTITGVPPFQYFGSNRAPVFTQVSSLETDLVPVNVQIAATDPDGDPLVYSAVGLPPGLSIGYQSGRITGTPTSYTYDAPSSVTVTATDTKSGAARSTTFAWRINTPGNADPVIAQVPARTTAAGVQDSFQLGLSDPTADAVTVTARGLPPGITMTSAGLISGRPTAGGVYQVALRAVDQRGGFANSTFQWTVTNLPPVIPALADQVSAIGATNAGFPIAPTDPDGHPVTLTVSGLPTGMTFSATTRSVSGIPSTAGTYVVAVKATDPYGGVSNKVFTWSVSSAANHPPTMTQLANMSLPPGIAFNLPITTTDADGHKVSVLFKGLPTGVAFNATKMAIIGIPTVGGIYTVQYSVLDAFGGKTTYPDVTWTVPNNPPVLSGPGNATILPGVSASIPFTLSDPDGHAMTLTSTGLPRGLTPNAISKAIAGTPVVSGTFPVTLYAKDKYGGVSATSSFTITIPNNPPVVRTPLSGRTTAVGAPQSVSLDVVDPDGHPLVITAASGTLPRGLTIDSLNKVITGKPAAAGTFNVALTVADKYGASVKMPVFQWVVTNQAPTLGLIAAQSSIVGQPVAVSLTATDPDGNNVVISATGLPPGLRVVGMNVTGTPTTAGSYSPIFSIKDAYGLVSAAKVTTQWIVRAP